MYVCLFVFEFCTYLVDAGRGAGRGQNDLKKLNSSKSGMYCFVVLYLWFILNTKTYTHTIRCCWCWTCSSYKNKKLRRNWYVMY